MIIFTENKYIPTSADIFQLSVDDNGYVLVSKDVYDSLLDMQARGSLQDMYTAFEVKPTYAMEFFTSAVPAPLTYLSILFDRLTFEPENKLDVLFGICSVILEPQTFTCILEQGLELFKLREYSQFILKEYQIPRRVFLTSCIPYEQLLNPDVVPNKINILVLGDGGTMTTGALPMGASPMQGAGVTTTASTSSYSESNDPDNQLYYISRKDEYVYFGEGTFVHKESGTMVGIDMYNETVINKAFGVEPPPELTMSAESTEEPVAPKAATTIEVSADDEFNRRRAMDLFSKTRDQRNL